VDAKIRADSTVDSRLQSWRQEFFPRAAQNPPLMSEPRLTASLARALAPILIVFVFWLDRLAPAGVAVPALYVAPALLFLRSGRFWEPLLVALAATALTIGNSFLVSRTGNVDIDRMSVPLELLIVWLSAGVVAYHRVAGNRWSEHVERKRNMLEQTIVRLDELRRALDQAAIVAITDRRGIITDVNEKFCTISKYSREELVGQDHRIINSGHHAKEFMRDLWRTIAAGRVWRGEIRNRAKDGTLYWVDTTIVPLLDERGKPREYLAIRSDITEKKAAQAKLADQAALAQLGQLAAIVAHEVRNPLAGLRGSLEILEPRFAASSREREVVQAMIGRIDTLNAKVNDILRFARPVAPLVQSLDLDPIVRDSMANAAAAVGRDCPPIEYAATSQVVRADAEMLRAALLNLLLNACQAGSRRVEIRTSFENDWCRISILDDGVGIPDDVVAHMFEAFYTTKKTGTGLGLPIVKRLVELQGGTVSVTPRQGGGTRAEITLSHGRPRAGVGPAVGAVSGGTDAGRVAMP
jgi:two-component system CheB/CheR fusion protein